MKTIRRSFSLRALTERVQHIFGRVSTGAIALASLLTPGWIDWNAKAGKRYDNSAVFAAIAWLQRRSTEATLIVERKGNHDWNEVDHELPTLIESGAGPYDGATLMYGTLLWLIVDGNAYWYKLRSAAGKLVGFVLLDTTRVTPSSHKYNDPTNPAELITFYEYHNPDGMIYDIPPSDIVHFRDGIDPADHRRGLSRIAAAVREIVSDNEAAELNVALLRNGGIAGVAFEPAENLKMNDPATVKLVEDRAANRMTGAGAGRPIIMPMAGKWTVIGFSPDKLAIKDQRALAVSRILSGIGIDPMVLGFPSEQKTYSNYKEAHEAAIENAFLPTIMLISRTLTASALRTEFPQFARVKYRVGWDLSGIRALADDVDATWERVGKAWERNLITRKDAKVAMKLVPQPDDDVYYSDVVTSAPAEGSGRELGATEKLQEMKDEDEEEDTPPDAGEEEDDEDAT